MFNESDHPRDKKGKFAEKGGKGINEPSEKGKQLQSDIERFKGDSAEQTKQKILSEELTKSEETKSIGTEERLTDEENIISYKPSMALPKINVNQDWVYQPDDKTDLTDLKQNPIPYVGIGKDFEIGTAVEDARQKEYKSNVDIDISRLETFQPFVLGSGIDDYKHWDNTERPYVVEYKNHFYLLDGNHRVAKAKLEGKKTIKVDLSVRIDKKKI